MLPFELRSLEVFLSVCEHGTMSAAARALGLTQSAVSQVINDLEQRTKSRLFDREVRPLGLTLGGVVLRQRASSLIADARLITPLLQDVGRGKLPLIRVGLVDSFSRLLIPELFNHLIQRAEHVSFVSGLTASHVDDILARRLDVLLGIDEFETVDGLETWPLIEEPFFVVAPYGTPAPETREQLQALCQSLAFIRYHPRRKMGVSIERHLRRIGLDLPRTHEFDTPFGVAAMVANGGAWAITTPLCLYEAGDLVSKLQCFPLPGPGFKRRLSLLSRARELAKVPQLAAGLTTTLLENELLPLIRTHAPWAESATLIGEKIRNT
ncbi:DNA-binding transcriptional LysR family regulator [Rhizobium sp. BK313]|uniref:LysR family transcriptional regulator n=1 Tax=Rhizobium sp. BK313 TaxID=2587081 RepID=UPI00105D1D8A|nr:LysR family transcriptional regulator [Rhizobium sp. BK313]MBB3459317.1 DNA-binding transcriptional LysR family regulator [Rhizobium sp. BK313]